MVCHCLSKPHASDRRHKPIVSPTLPVPLYTVTMSLTAESSTGLKREMGLRDVTLFAIACIVGTRWIPAAAHAGPGSVLLWLAAALLQIGRAHV